MAKQSTNVNINVTINAAKANLAYYPIEDGDYETAKFYESNGVAVRTITLNGTAHRYALIEVDTPAQAALLNREFNRLRRQEQRDAQRRATNELSYDCMVEDGYDPATDNCNPLEMLVDSSVKKALYRVLDTLTEENRLICQMIAAKKSERAMADELGIPRMTLHDRKTKLLKELEELLHEYK